MRALATVCRGLQHIDLSATRVTDAGVSFLAAGCSQLRSLDVSNTHERITDATAFLLAAAATTGRVCLQAVDFSFTAVGPEAVATLLVRTVSLQSVTVTRARISGRFQSELAAIRPSCVVIVYRS